MNVKNNQRRKNSQERMMKGLMELLSSRNLNEITVSDVVKIANVNRSTFYANYIDLYDLVDKTREYQEMEFTKLFSDYDYFTEDTGALKMFQHIKENQKFYEIYFKLCYNDRNLVTIYDHKRAMLEDMDSNIKYHIEFFRNGLNAIIKLWIEGGCKESPEEMAYVIKQEYKGRYVLHHEKDVR